MRREKVDMQADQATRQEEAVMQANQEQDEDNPAKEHEEHETAKAASLADEQETEEQAPEIQGRRKSAAGSGQGKKKARNEWEN